MLDQLPLHVALQSGKDWKDGIKDILVDIEKLKYHKNALMSHDFELNLPLHYAVKSSGYRSTRRLVALYPDALKYQDNQGRLPLHSI